MLLTSKWPKVLSWWTLGIGGAGGSEIWRFGAQVSWQTSSGYVWIFCFNIFFTIQSPSGRTLGNFKCETHWSFHGSVASDMFAPQVDSNAREEALDRLPPGLRDVKALLCGVLFGNRHRFLGEKFVKVQNPNELFYRFVSFAWSCKWSISDHDAVAISLRPIMWRIPSSIRLQLPWQLDMKTLEVSLSNRSPTTQLQPFCRFLFAKLQRIWQIWITQFILKRFEPCEVTPEPPGYRRSQSVPKDIGLREGF